MKTSNILVVGEQKTTQCNEPHTSHAAVGLALRGLKEVSDRFIFSSKVGVHSFDKKEASAPGNPSKLALPTNIIH
jgi:hypothetical protein